MQGSGRDSSWRVYAVIVLLIAVAGGLLARIIYLGVVKRDFLIQQGVARSVRYVNTPPHRGVISDRNGELLAMSTPVRAICISPKDFYPTPEQLEKLTMLLDMDVKSLQNKMANLDRKREFVYLSRSMAPHVAEKILALNIGGVFSKHEYKRYYPEADVTAHVIGFTNIDDQGQEGLELAYDKWLRGVPGKVRVLKDRLGHIVEKLDVISEPQEGNNLVLSIDRRIQYLAYRELKEAIDKHQAESGSVVVLAANTGEILAMVNYPTYNPNNRAGVPVSHLRNRAIVDLFEPGSTMKAFSIASALQSGKYRPETLINTNPGVLHIGSNVVYDDDHLNNGTLTLAEVLKKSSNIGVAKITLSLPADRLLGLLRSVGFGQTTQSGFPGEVAGWLPNHSQLRPFVLATLAFGYSVSTTTLQLAQAYGVIAAQGVLRPITFLKVDQTAIPGKQVLSKKVAQQLLTMLQSVLEAGGTGGAWIRVPGYTIAGKTGTSRMINPHGGYYSDKHRATFVGIAPAINPSVVAAVVINNPRGRYFHGSSVAGPVFARIVAGTLRILSVPPDIPGSESG